MNRDEDRLIYIQQSAPGLQVSNATFSIPEIGDIRAHLKTIGKLGTFSMSTSRWRGSGKPVKSTPEWSTAAVLRSWG
jgi:hypothetical protein